MNRLVPNNDLGTYARAKHIRRIAMIPTLHTRASVDRTTVSVSEDDMKELVHAIVVTRLSYHYPPMYLDALVATVFQGMY